MNVHPKHPSPNAKRCVACEDEFLSVHKVGPDIVCRWCMESFNTNMIRRFLRLSPTTRKLILEDESWRR